MESLWPTSFKELAQSMRKHASVLLLPATLAIAGCPPPNVKTSYDNSKPAVPTDPVACPITIQLENQYERASRGTRMISEVACLSISGDAIALPTNMKLWVSKEGWDHYRVCQEKTVETKEGQDFETCTWNGVFRHSYPWTIRLHSNSDRGLASQIKAARVFLNGDLVWKWVPPSNDTRADLEIRGEELKRTLLPEGAAIDLRLIPQGVEVDQDALDAKVERRPRQWERQLQIVRDAVLSSPSFANGKLKEKLQCLVFRARATSYNASQIAGTKLAVPPPLPEGCEAPPSVDVPESLSAKYAQLKSMGADEFKQRVGQLKAEFDAAMARYRTEAETTDKAQATDFKGQATKFWAGEGGAGTWWAELDGKDTEARTAARKALLAFLSSNSAAEDAVLTGRADDVWGNPPKVKVQGALPPRPRDVELAWLRTRGTEEKFKAELKKVDGMVEQALDTLDEAQTLQTELLKDVQRFAKSTDEQAQLFLRVANDLQGTSPLQQMHDNPALLPGERALGMRYSDRWQFFGIAPWTGFPMDVEDGSADVSPANLIPIVDLVGFRYQWSESRFADLRGGLGVTALSFTTEVPNNPDASVSQLRFAPELNLGIANLKLGVSYATFGGGLTSTERLRLIVGADLYKVISGNNLEVF